MHFSAFFCLSTSFYRSCSTVSTQNLLLIFEVHFAVPAARYPLFSTLPVMLLRFRPQAIYAVQLSAVPPSLPLPSPLSPFTYPLTSPLTHSLSVFTFLLSLFTFHLSPFSFHLPRPVPPRQTGTSFFPGQTPTPSYH